MGVVTAGSVDLNVMSTSPGTGTSKGCESVPAMVNVPVNVSVTVGGANDDGCVGTVDVESVDEQPDANTQTVTNAGNQFLIFPMLLDSLCYSLPRRAIFAHVSRSETVRLKTSEPGFESGSTQK